jgi:hypothetical protein
MLFEGQRVYIWLFISLLNIAIKELSIHLKIELKIMHFHLNRIAKKINCVENCCSLYKMQFEKKKKYLGLGFVETAVLIEPD